MKALVAYGKRDLRVETIPDPVCGPDEVVLAVDYGGICGSDVHYWLHGASGLAVLRQPLVLGHEVAGHIVEVGRNVTDWHVGQHVTPHPALACAGCPPELASSTAYYGSAGTMPHTQGAFSRYRAVPTYQLRALPHALDLRTAALTEPLSVALHALTRAGGVAGKTVLVSGCGPIGNLVIAAARAAGARHITAVDLENLALRLALESGADRTVNLASGERLPQDVDITFEASGAPSAIGAGLTATRRGGTMVQVGNLPPTGATVQLAALTFREITYCGTFRFGEEIVQAIDALAGGIRVDQLITHTFPLAAAPEAFATAADRTHSSKVLLRFTD